MKPDIHPNFKEATVICACGAEFKTMSTVSELRVEVCSKCHPFFTGKRKYVDTAGRVDKFRKKYESFGAGGSAKKSEVEEATEAEEATKDEQN